MPEHRTSAATAMTAAVSREFGAPEVVRHARVAKPRAPHPGEVLIGVRASTVSIADSRVRAKRVPTGTSLLASFTIGFRAPRIPVLGMDCSGIVEAVGEGVTHVAPGDEVIALLGSAFGGHAEYAIVGTTSTSVVRKPANLSFEEGAAIVFGGWTARTYLDVAGVKAGDTVLVNGASGAVGTAAVQLAAHAGAHVTGVCSARNADLVSSLGADRVIDYTTTDPVDDQTRYDIVVDNVGNIPFERLATAVKPGGTVLGVIAGLPDMIKAPMRGLRAGIRVVPANAPFDRHALERVAELATVGAFRPVIDRTYEFTDIVAAHRYVDTNRKRGNVVVRVP
ncbi:NADPH:quinone reductase [Pseudoclavibacter endophyticus]|uniref:NAD(P)-dependent alcohol dehydrogenase n=1 Tax=Pseudoclavibacter endophyticus TaxID=1778590 RepID=A0A6H9WET6_9MICO|nr:NAD(P)-dependent alcohol dehydrogenase [Pseudoclavibacter endophyticus]KAB1649439.1 NAD(P)-dependent alcohol dehydrogenase [Pseudoclavibacter endophyticus]GGA62649.1 NADPH:quinone reductase [Pseudoclavibacter endophyticus]